MKQYRLSKCFAAATALLIAGLVFGCGTSSTGDGAGDADTTLAEQTADLPREGYNALLNGPTPTPAPTPITGGGNGTGNGSASPGVPTSNFIMQRFLWKPVSDSNGNVAVLVDPTNVDVVVNGANSETLNNVGPSNGRGTTARGELPGCDYGEGGPVTVTFFRNGERIGFTNGQISVNVGDGCERVEFDLR